MALVFSNTFDSFTGLASLPTEVDKGSFGGYSGVEVTSIVVKLRKGLNAGSVTTEAAVRVTGETLSGYASSTTTFDGLEEKVITLTFSSPPTARLDGSSRVSVYVRVTEVTGSLPTWCANANGQWLQINGTLVGSGELAKPTTPSPADASGPGIDWSTWTISWVDGGGAETYDVFMGTSEFALNRVVEGTALTIHMFALGQRPAVTGGVVYWRVDAIAGEDRGTGDVWSFDPRPAKPAIVSPADEATDQTLHVGAEWGVSAGATTYDFRIVEDNVLVPTVISGLTETDLDNIGSYLKLKHDTKYYWRIDTRNSFGVTEGDSWWFRTMPFQFVIPSWELLPGMTLGPLTGGVEGIDFRWIGNNNMVTTKRLVAAADNRIWYEDV